MSTEFVDATNILNEHFEARIGSIKKIYQQNTNDKTDKRLFCDVEVFPAGFYENVPFWGGGVDLNTNFPHGIFSPPREHQMVLILFINANYENPFASIPIPMNSDKSFIDKYNDIMENINDIAIYHYSGSRFYLRENGKIELQKRIEENTNDFHNHALTIEFVWDSGNSSRKKIIKDEDNNISITMEKNDTIIQDSAGNKITLTSQSGSEKIKLEDKNGNVIETTTTSVKINGNFEVLQ